MASWNSLPIELRHSILEHVAGQNPNIAKHSPRGSAPENEYAWAPYAAVSRAWQAFFERRAFAALALQNEDVQPFSAAIAHSPERLAYIGRLQLTIDLPAYLERESSNKDEDEATMKRHSVLFSRHLWWLLRALSAWKEPAPADGGPLWLRDDAMFRAGTFSSAVGMQLELGVRCVSDTAYRNYRFPLPDGPLTMDNRSQILRDMGIRCLGNDGYLQDLRSLTVRPAAYRRVLGGRLLVLGKDPEDRRRRRHRHTLPVAAVVRKLVLARSCTRGIHPATLERLLRVSLPRVQSVHLEQWRPATAANRDALLRGYGALLTRLPPAVDRLSLFVESDCMLHYCERHPEPVQSPAELRAERALLVAWLRLRGTQEGTPMPDQLQRLLQYPPRPPPLLKSSRRWPPPNLSRPLAVASRRLVVLNAAFVAEADDVLAAVASMPAATSWPRLRTLVLTSATLTPEAGPEAIAQLLRAAAAAAARMPHLRQFELWHARGAHACAFTVVNGDDAAAAQPQPRLRFRATWPQAGAALTHDVLAAWRAVVATWTHRPLRVHNALQPRPAIPPWIDARRLVFKGKTTLARDVLCAQSRKDMAQERHWKKRPRDKHSKKRKRRPPIF